MPVHKVDDEPAGPRRRSQSACDSEAREGVDLFPQQTGTLEVSLQPQDVPDPDLLSQEPTPDNKQPQQLPGYSRGISLKGTVRAHYILWSLPSLQKTERFAY